MSGIRPDDDVTAAARSAVARWADAAEAALSGTTSPALREFRIAAASAAAGSNVRAGKLRHYLDRDPSAIVSTHEVTRARHGDHEADRRLYQGLPWGPRRAAVEGALTAMRTAVYATLDVGRTAGTPAYGDYRLVFTPQGARPPLVLCHNSALRYGGADGTARTELMLEEVALWESRGDVALCVLASEVDEDPATWPALLVRERPLGGSEYDIDGEPHDLMEVVCRDGEIPIGSITSVRITREYCDTMESGSHAAIGAMLGTNDHDEIDAELSLYFALAGDEDPLLPGVSPREPIEVVEEAAQ